MDKAFVFVVCGAREHIDTLHYALKALLPRTKNDVIVVTDPARNEIPVEHDNIVNVAAPEHFTHHQASIWLKTSLHRRLPNGAQYVYLDTDIIAVGDRVDEIFDQFIAPIRFAYDHCVMPRFSPYAVNCNCKESYDKFTGELNAYLDANDPYRLSGDSEVQVHRVQLHRTLAATFQNKARLVVKGLQFLLPKRFFHLDDRYRFDKRKKVWLDPNGKEIMSHIPKRKMARTLGFRYSLLKQEFQFRNGSSIWVNQCQHLKEYIKEKFGVSITNPAWRHRNGGVFIFNDASHDFLDTWHEFTLEIFKDPQWKTRDQGTLIATYWKHGAQNQEALDKQWNFICDFYNYLLRFDPENNTVTDDGTHYIQPQFLHIYHHFGDTSWDLWNWADKLARTQPPRVT